MQSLAKLIGNNYYDMELNKRWIWVLAVFLFTGCAESENQRERTTSSEETAQKDWALVIHGGAGVISEDMPDSVKQAYQEDLEEAGSYLLRDLLEPGDAGIIAVDKYGNTLMEMNTQGMFRGTSDSEGTREVAIWN